MTGAVVFGGYGTFGHLVARELARLPMALTAARNSAASPARVRVTLLIGNNNPKGRAAIRSLVLGLGKPVQAPQGMLRGFRGREVVPLPEPFGRRAVFNFDSPEYDLFP